MRDGSDICIGVLVPAGNTVHEREFARLRPKSVTFRFGGFSYPPAASPDFCGDLAAQLETPMRSLVATGAQLVLIGCTTASMTCAGDAFIATLRALAGVPVITAASASHEAIVALGVTALSVATPYGDINNSIVANFVASLGVRVAGIAGMDLDRSLPIWLAGQPTLTPRRVLEFSLSVDMAMADALYLPCTGMGSLEAIDMFEAQTGKPAVSSVQAGFWASLRLLDVDGRQSGGGRLLEIWDF